MIQVYPTNVSSHATNPTNYALIPAAVNARTMGHVRHATKYALISALTPGVRIYAQTYAICVRCRVISSVHTRIKNVVKYAVQNVILNAMRDVPKCWNVGTNVLRSAESCVLRVNSV